jgi:hypothetical protein
LKTGSPVDELGAGGKGILAQMHCFCPDAKIGRMPKQCDHGAPIFLFALILPTADNHQKPR